MLVLWLGMSRTLALRDVAQHLTEAGFDAKAIAALDHFLPRLGMSLYNMFYQNQKVCFP